MTGREQYEKRLKRLGKSRTYTKRDWEQPGAELNYLDENIARLYMLKKLDKKIKPINGCFQPIDYDILIAYWLKEREKLVNT
jgi:hypothetical protein